MGEVLVVAIRVVEGKDVPGALGKVHHPAVDEGVDVVSPDAAA